MSKKIFLKLPATKWIAIIFICLASLIGTQSTAQTDTAVSIQQMLDAHNAFRTEVGVPELTWSDEIAEFAQKWADELAGNKGCKLSHRPRGENDPWKQLYGENIYSGGGTNWFPTVLDAVKSWGEEKEHFDLQSKTCKNGSICGHYTQMIWKNSTKLGCAVARCPNGNVIVVCNYDPPGNFNGEAPF